MKTKSTYLLTLAVAAALGVSSISPNLHAAGLTASDGEANDTFGYSVSQSGNIGLVGAITDYNGANFLQGSAYVFRSLDTATGSITQNVKLTASDGTSNDFFGYSVSQSGNVGLVGAPISNNSVGSAYVFRNLNTATGTITENVKLTPNDGLGWDDYFGASVSLSGSIGLVGAYLATGRNDQGSAYVFRNLDTAIGTITQDVKLSASDFAANDRFGLSVSQSGTIGLVGAYLDDVGPNIDQGSAYVFRGLDTRTGTITQDVKLTASDGAASDQFGTSLSLSGSIGVVGAYGDDIGANTDQGSAYVFRSLDTATGSITQNVKLTAFDGAGDDVFGYSVSLSGSIGLVGASGDDVGSNGNQGSAYVFRSLDTATGSITQNVKLTASDGEAADYFGVSVGLNGDQFVIGAYGKNSFTGKAYSGSVASVTTLDTGDTSKTISQISFESQDDWIVGQTTDANNITLSASDTANVTASGKAVYIGKNAGSDNNVLILFGKLNTSTVNIGSKAGNVGNLLSLKSGSTLKATNLRLASRSFLKIDGKYMSLKRLRRYLGSAKLQVQHRSVWTTINAKNYRTLLTSKYKGGITTITPFRRRR